MKHLSARTVLGTILVLSALEVVASSSAAAGRLGGALQGLGTATRYLMSPSVPLVPDLRKPAKGAGNSAGYQQTAQTIPRLPPVQG